MYCCYQSNDEHNCVCIYMYVYVQKFVDIIIPWAIGPLGKCVDI